jgi:hypothetical protein
LERYATRFSAAVERALRRGERLRCRFLPDATAHRLGYGCRFGTLWQIALVQPALSRMQQAAPLEIRSGQIDAYYAFARALPRPHLRLRMLAARLGDAGQCTAGGARAVGKGDVAERQNSHQALFMVQHG